MSDGMPVSDYVYMHTYFNSISDLFNCYEVSILQFLQIEHNLSCMMCVHRSEYLFTLSDKNYVRHQQLFVCKHYLVFANNSSQQASK